jgi:hypothetical protein
MDIARGRAHLGGRQLAQGAAVVVLAAVLIALMVALPTSSQPTMSSPNESRSNVRETTVSGRPHAYHSTSGSSCTNAVLLRKRGRVCLDPGHGRSRNDRTDRG